MTSLTATKVNRNPVPNLVTVFLCQQYILLWGLRSFSNNKNSTVNQIHFLIRYRVWPSCPMREYWNDLRLYSIQNMRSTRSYRNLRSLLTRFLINWYSFRISTTIKIRAILEHKNRQICDHLKRRCSDTMTGSRRRERSTILLQTVGLSVRTKDPGIVVAKNKIDIHFSRWDRVNKICEISYPIKIPFLLVCSNSMRMPFSKS